MIYQYQTDLDSESEHLFNPKYDIDYSFINVIQTKFLASPVFLGILLSCIFSMFILQRIPICLIIYLYFISSRLNPVDPGVINTVNNSICTVYTYVNTSSNRWHDFNDK